ncbi:hypothetical protein BJ979_002995 [Schumannella luteola]|uniref:GH26 domain-containing protein n=1 Tax=Schumannella luteola TaxID=472059 RepID=A0A852YRN8_9MICO|nr:hypothetical protein [Schumannella luteola]
MSRGRDATGDEQPVNIEQSEVDASSDPQQAFDQGFVGHPKRRRRPSLLVPLVIMALVAGGVAVGSNQIASQAVAPASSIGSCLVGDREALVPKKGVLFGVNLDWDSETLAEHAENIGHNAAVSVQFSDIPYDRETWSHTLGAVEQVKANGGILLLTLEPHGGLSTLSDTVIQRLAKDLRDINAEGVPVIVRFAHEMNGSWYAWGQQPELYIETFRRVAQAVHERAPLSSMMWAPNYGGGYPFTGGQFAAEPGTADFADLDTDGDGALTMADDSYAPYYPGDAAVDWVGISLYHWGNQRPWGDNDIAEPHKFEDMLTGTYVGTAGDDSAVPDFYQEYGVDHGHPVAIPETAAIYTPSRRDEPGSSSEIAVKSAWWDQVFAADIPTRFPQLKMINWFEWSKVEVEIDDRVDWRAASSTATRSAFRKALPGWFEYAEDVRGC